MWRRPKTQSTEQHSSIYGSPHIGQASSTAPVLPGAHWWQPTTILVTVYRKNNGCYPLTLIDQIALIVPFIHTCSPIHSSKNNCNNSCTAISVQLPVTFNRKYVAVQQLRSPFFARRFIVHRSHRISEMH